MKQWLTNKFEDFAMLECEGSSELYKNLSLQIAKDDELLTLCLDTREGQPVPNMLFGAVHYLLLQGMEHEVKEYYPSVVEKVQATGNPFPLFKDFCITNESEIKQLLQSKLVQTNEVRRCAYLYPLFCYVYQQTGESLSLIEIGTSAGLQLLFDQYAYSYDGKEICGNKDASVHLTSQVREGNIPHDLVALHPVVNDRVGIDLNITDLNNEKEYLWLKALIWPEHEQRLSDFEGAVAQLKINPPNMIEGDGVALLPKMLEAVPEDTTLCIFHTHVANQMPDTVKEALLQQIDAIGKGRDVFHIYNNMYDRKLHIDSIIDGQPREVTVGETDGHGRWFDWNIT